MFGQRLPLLPVQSFDFNNIEIYVLFIEPIKVIINGLLSSIEKITYPQIKEMEDFIIWEELCVQSLKILIKWFNYMKKRKDSHIII